MNMKILKRCRKATIYDDEKNLLCQCSVYLDEEEKLMISAPKDFDYKQQETYEVIFFDPVLGLIPCRCELEPPLSLSDQMYAYGCLVHHKGEQIQRRMDIKVPVEIPITLHTDGVIGGNVACITGGGYPATMTDISAGGTFIVSEVWIDAGKLVTFEFNESKMPISLTAEVLRVIENTDEEGHVTYGHGCRFPELSRVQEAQVRNFVFQKERELYKNDIW